MDQYEMQEQELAFLLEKTGWLSEEITLDEALRKYQAWHGLLVDGTAGAQTHISLTAPRFCGYPDQFEPPMSIGGGINRWGKHKLNIEVRGSLGRLRAKHGQPDEDEDGDADPREDGPADFLGAGIIEGMHDYMRSLR